MTTTTEKRAMRGRRLRPRRLGVLAIGLSAAAMALTSGIGTAADDGDDGREPGAVPGEPSTATSSTGAVTDGRSAADVAARGQARAATTASSASASTDNGRGGPDPAAGPNQVTADAARAAVAAESGVDTDSGVVPAPDAARTAAAPVAPDGSDQDVPGASAPSSPGDADPAGSESPVDQDS